MKSLKSRLYCSLVCATAVMIAHNSANAESLTVALSELSNSHPQIRAAENTALGMRESADKAWGAYLPTLDLSADTGYEHSNTPARRAANLDEYSRGRNSYTVTLTQTLWNGGEREAAYASAQHQHKAAIGNTSSTIQNVLYEGISAYLDILKQAELVKLASGNEANIREQLKLEDERVRRGSGITVDVLQAKTRLQLAKERRVAFEGAFQAASSRYNQVFGHPADIATMTTPIPPENRVPETLQAAIDQAMENNPVIQSREAEAQAMQSNRQAVKSGYYPTIDLVLEHNYENGVDTTIGTRRDYTALVQARWNLFNGMQTRADVHKASFDYAASRQNLTHASRKVEEQTRLAWQDLDTTRKRVDLLQNAVNIAGEVLVSRQKLREAGKETALNVLDAENEVYNARINYTSALFEMKRSVYNLLLAMGELKPGTI